MFLFWRIQSLHKSGNGERNDQLFGKISFWRFFYMASLVTHHNRTTTTYTHGNRKGPGFLGGL
jgi:hypothetical protein